MQGEGKHALGLVGWDRDNGPFINKAPGQQDVFNILRREGHPLVDEVSAQRRIEKNPGRHRLTESRIRAVKTRFFFHTGLWTPGCDGVLIPADHRIHIGDLFPE